MLYFYSSSDYNLAYSKICSTQFTIESTRANKIASSSDSTLNAGTILDAIRTITPLITKENSPRVTILIGIDTIKNKGLIV